MATEEGRHKIQRQEAPVPPEPFYKCHSADTTQTWRRGRTGPDSGSLPYLGGPRVLIISGVLIRLRILPFDPWCEVPDPGENDKAQCEYRVRVLGLPRYLLSGKVPRKDGDCMCLM